MSKRENMKRKEVEKKVMKLNEGVRYRKKNKKMKERENEEKEKVKQAIKIIKRRKHDRER